METRVLEHFPFWPCYLILPVVVVFLIACLWACGVHVLAAFVVRHVPNRRFPGYLSTAFLTFCAITAFWALFSMMFGRFHAVAIAQDHIELVYCWPRPNLSLQTSSLRSASVHQYRGGGCRVEIFSDRGIFRSVDSDETQVAKQIRQAVDIMTKR